MWNKEQLPAVTSQEAENVLLWSEKKTHIKLGHIKIYIWPCMALKMFTKYRNCACKRAPRDVLLSLINARFDEK